MQVKLSQKHLLSALIKKSFSLKAATQEAIMYSSDICFVMTHPQALYRLPAG